MPSQRQALLVLKTRHTDSGDVLSRLRLQIVKLVIAVVQYDIITKYVRTQLENCTITARVSLLSGCNRMLCLPVRASAPLQSGIASARQS